jgi:hypothetical protein
MVRTGSSAYIPLLLLSLTAVPAAQEGRQSASATAGVHSDRIVFKCREDLITADIEPLRLLTLLGLSAQKRGLVRIERAEKWDIHRPPATKAAARMSRIFHGFLSVSSRRDDILAWLQRNPLIEYAEPLYYHTLDILPNDSLYAQQTHLQVINLPSAWDIARGSAGSVVVAIVDGGTDIRHRDLQGNLWLNQDEIAGNSRDDDENGFVDDIHGWNFANSSNDPTGLATQPAFGNHGTHTAGIACAVTGNVHGIAGAAWNCRLMPVNAADPFGEGIGYGYEAILYAAGNGARIINCSWGRSGAPSAYEQDVIDYVTSLGAVVVASAGNSGSTTLNYPACYRNVFAVAATNNWDAKAGFSSYGRWIDVSAPGVDILSSTSGDSYSRYSGTSMSAPLAAGVIALVETLHPEWSGFQCAEQVRATAHAIDDVNPSWTGLLGKGRVDAWQALTATTPAIRLTSVTFSGNDGDSQFRPGEHARIYTTLTNFLSASAPVTLSLTENSSYVSLLTSSVSLPGLAMLESATQGKPFEALIAGDAPAGHLVTFTLQISAGGFSDTDQFTLSVSPDFVDLTLNAIKTSVTSVGRIGFATPSAASGGSGFTYRSGANLLYEGSIIAGTASSQISSSARSMTTTPDQDFSVIAAGPLTLRRPGELSDEESTVSLRDLNAGFPMNIAVQQRTYASAAAENQDFIIFRYEVKNEGNQALTNFHFGLFFDWDVDGDHFDRNVAAYDPGRRLGYVYNEEGDPGTVAGCALLSPGTVSYRAILNDEQATGNPGWGIYDGFSDSEKWEAISGGVTISNAGAGDVSQVLAAGPYTIGAQESIVIDFVLLAGDDLQQVQVHTDQAAEFRRRYLVATPDSARLRLKQGWNLVSSWVAPDDSLLENLLAPITGALLLVKDGAGKAYWPAYHIDLLTYWDFRQGYWFYVTEAAELLLTGRLAASGGGSQALQRGWNLIAYLRPSPAAVENVFSGIAGELLLVKDGAGHVYWPAYHIDTIGEMQPGLGYYLYLNNPATLEWP